MPRPDPPPAGRASMPAIVSPDDQTVTFVELFFDLVFVFSVTQVVGLLHGGLDGEHIGQAVLVFWLVWWAWTQFTWALNAADTTHPWVGLGTLVATAIAFFMAVAIPGAFHGSGLWFAVPYIVVRMLGLGLYAWVAAANNPSQHAAVRTFAFVSLGGLAAVLVGGLMDETTRYALWGLAIFLDVIAATVGVSAGEWDLHPEHFAERHGLFVIIALGETLIVAAGGLTTGAWTPELGAVAILAVATTCALWWSYFATAKPALDHALESQSGTGQSAMARDTFSLLHFPMLCGVIAFAVAIEETVAHPATPLALPGRLALGLGVALFVAGMAVATWRARHRLLAPRLLFMAATVGALAALPLRPPFALAVALVGVVAVAAWEQLFGCGGVRGFFAAGVAAAGPDDGPEEVRLG